MRELSDKEKKLAQAERWANRVACQQSKADKKRCVRRTLDALYSILPPKPDGSHPLDARNLTLRGE
jgi:hypothetical protein